MNYGEFNTLSRAMYRSANENTIFPATHLLITNKGIEDICKRGNVLYKKAYFSAVADDGTYLLSDIDSKYVNIHGSGIWFNTGTVASPSWKKLNPQTIESMDEEKPNWRETSSGTPQDYIIEGNDVIISPAPSTALADAFLINIYIKSDEVTKDADYMFNGTVEIPHLQALDMPLIKYWIWQAGIIMGKGKDEIIADEQNYLADLMDKLTIINARIDIEEDRYSRFRGKRVT